MVYNAPVYNLVFLLEQPVKNLSVFGFLLAISTATNALAGPALDGMPDVGTRLAPAELSKEAYLRWAEPILNAQGVDRTSPFTNQIFAWYEANKNTGLPEQVNKDPQKIYADVATAKAETIALEDAGEIEKYVAAGANVYAEIQGTPEQVLESTLYLWGKPIGQAGGKTKPAAQPTHANRADWLEPNEKWGPGAYANLEVRKNGGIVRDLSDHYLLLVRGDATKGFTVLMQFAAPQGKTETSHVLAIAIIKPLGNGKVAHKIASRYMGQSYGILGPIGREQMGFNQTKVRSIEKKFIDYVTELRTTGKIADQVNDL